MAANVDNIQAMGLTPLDTSDKIVKFNNYRRRAQLQDAVKLTDTELANYDSFWRKTNTTPGSNQVSCMIPIWLANISAVVTAGHTDGVSDKHLQAKFYLCKEETSVWAKQYLRFSSETENNKARLKSTAPESTYDVKHYDRHIPQLIRSASDKYITMFFNRHTGANPLLTKAMITISYASFMCYEISGEQPAIDDHVETVHGLTDGVETLKENQVIQVDSKITFTLPSLLDIELLGPDMRKNKFANLYMICVARDVLKKSSNEANSDLNRSRSIEFMDELKKSCNITYFERFKMYLMQLIGSTENIDGNFSCKWTEIKSALTSAINKEQNVVRLGNFLEKDYESFHSLPLELLIGNVSKWVDSVQGTSSTYSKDSKGRMISEFTFCIFWKYKIIYNIANHLPGDMRQLKEVITQKITKMFDEKSTVVDIPEFQTFLITEFKKKSILTSYKCDNVPSPKKGMTVNETTIEKGKGKGDKGDKSDK